MINHGANTAQETEQFKTHTVVSLFTQRSKVYVNKLLSSSIWKKSWMQWVVIPLSLVCVYFSVIASDRYVSEAKVIVKQADSAGQSELGISLLGAATAPGVLDAQLLRDFVLSLDMLHFLEESLLIRVHYESSGADVFSRLNSSATQEEFLQYYRDHIEVSYDELSGILTIRAQAFDAKYGQQLMQSILVHSETFLNQISQRMASEQVGFVEGELERAQEQLRESKQKILAFQSDHNLFSPEQESGARLQIVNELDAELTRGKAELKNLLSYMNEASADVVAIKNRLSALESQLAVERGKLVSDQPGVSLNDVNAAFTDLQMSLEFATDYYKNSLLSLEQTRIEAYRKLKYLVVVDSPSLAESAEYPRRLYRMGTIFILLSMAYGVSVIILATIREHRDI